MGKKGTKIDKIVNIHKTVQQAYNYNRRKLLKRIKTQDVVVHFVMGKTKNIVFVIIQ